MAPDNKHNKSSRNKDGFTKLAEDTEKTVHESQDEVELTEYVLSELDELSLAKYATKLKSCIISLEQLSSDINTFREMHINSKNPSLSSDSQELRNNQLVKLNNDVENILTIMIQINYEYIVKKPSTNDRDSMIAETIEKIKLISNKEYPTLDDINPNKRFHNDRELSDTLFMIMHHIRNDMQKIIHNIQSNSVKSYDNSFHNLSLLLSNRASDLKDIIKKFALQHEKETGIPDELRKDTYLQLNTIIKTLKTFIDKNMSENNDSTLSKNDQKKIIAIFDQIYKLAHENQIESKTGSMLIHNMPPKLYTFGRIKNDRP